VLVVQVSPERKRELFVDTLSVLTICLVAAANWYRPHLVANEAVYLLPSLQWWDAGLLASDWTWGGDPWRSTSLMYGLLTAPLWALSDSPEVVALIGRAVSWLMLATAVVRLARALRLAPQWTVLGVSLFLLTGQGMAAGEWMFLGFERKPFAHAAALMALASVIRDRPLAAGAWSGVSVAMHILVGGWFGLAIGAAVLARSLDWGVRGVVRFAGGAAVFAAPFAIPSLLYLFSAESAEVAVPAATPERINWLVTAFRNPHHTLPSHFLNATKVGLFAAFSASAVSGSGHQA
jgi:hypothetical protein